MTRQAAVKPKEIDPHHHRRGFRTGERDEGVAESLKTANFRQRWDSDHRVPSEVQCEVHSGCRHPLAPGAEKAQRTAVRCGTEARHQLRGKLIAARLSSDQHDG